ncbi:hypothetical protein OG810_04575 [Streptomyces sp. NBC_01693]|uniref:hypothetical protein n=1 Tax=unclassified Streptomyces TaxID=2593676 RepID=UPI002E307A86|nr:hypothetical protein [Streptomyces sp. NBC_01693]
MRSSRGVLSVSLTTANEAASRASAVRNIEWRGRPQEGVAAEEPGWMKKIDTFTPLHRSSWTPTVLPFPWTSRRDRPSEQAADPPTPLPRSNCPPAA